METRVYDDSGYHYYSNLFVSGSWTGSESSAGCKANNKVNCSSITQNALGITDQSYDTLIGAQSDNSCTAFGRRLAQDGGIKNIRTKLVSAKKIDEVVFHKKLRWSDIKKAHGTNKRAIKKRAKAHCEAKFY